MEDKDLAEKGREMLLHFFHEIVGYVKLMWKEKSLKGETISKGVKTSDEAFAFYIMREYDRIPTKEDRKKDKLVGERLDNAMKIFQWDDDTDQTNEMGTLRMDSSVGQ